jgi:hypothetical protein
MLVTIFSLAASPQRENLLLARDVADLGAFSVGKSSAVSILTRLQEKKQEDQKAMMRSAVRKKRDSSRKITVLADIIHTVRRVFKHACVLHGEGYA